MKQGKKLTGPQPVAGMAFSPATNVRVGGSFFQELFED